MEAVGGTHPVLLGVTIIATACSILLERIISKLVLCWCLPTSLTMDPHNRCTALVLSVRSSTNTMVQIWMDILQVSPTTTLTTIRRWCSSHTTLITKITTKLVSSAEIVICTQWVRRAGMAHNIPNRTVAINLTKSLRETQVGMQVLNCTLNKWAATLKSSPSLKAESKEGTKKSKTKTIWEKPNFKLGPWTSTAKITCKPKTLRL